jgi:hypothetical protein
MDKRTYEYPFAARPVTFADGQARLAPLEELPSILAADTAARARAGLPPQPVRP